VTELRGVAALEIDGYSRGDRLNRSPRVDGHVLRKSNALEDEANRVAGFSANAALVVAVVVFEIGLGA
jgi:hypothetical protein